MFVQFCIFFLGGGALWFYLEASGILHTSDDVDAASMTPLAPPGGEPILAFLIFRLLPAYLGFVVLLVTEWLFFRVVSSSGD